ncbi:unnamed protein product [Clonostachys byssicola]|uniref:BTB domain-containing protein n=1 Tax=Clonostachys byssicola TaxID=160290 RepID=A0A9N9UIN0_9HYPO|nr:unnamed protein product [Clonostachys byssicola]
MADLQTYQQQFLDLLQSGKYSDFVLTCNGAEWKLHKAIACTKSPVIATALDGLYIEAQTGRISSTFDVATMGRLVQFLYIGDYSSSPGLAGTRPSLETLRDESRCLEAEINLNIAADYYGIQALSAICRLFSDRYRAERFINHSWDTASFLTLLKNAEDWVIDESMWQIMIDGAVAHIAELVRSTEFHEIKLKNKTLIEIMSAQVRMDEEAREGGRPSTASSSESASPA